MPAHDERPSGHDPPERAVEPLALDPSERALRCLISGTTTRGERASLLETIFSSRKATKIISRLRGRDAQTFIDVVDEVRYPSPTTEECVN